MHHPSPSKTITTTMGPFRRANAEYNYSEKTLAVSRGMKPVAGNKLKPSENANYMAKFCSRLKKVSIVLYHTSQHHSMKKKLKSWGLSAEDVEPALHSSHPGFPVGIDDGPGLLHGSTESELPGEYEPLRSPGKIPYTTIHICNFEFMEVALKASLNQRQVDALLDLIGHITKGSVWVTLKNDAELRKACDAAAAELTPCLFKYNGHKYKHFYDEPWTSDSWWDIQSSLPDILDATPFGLIIYADKTKLSSFGTAKGYPVVVQCANLPVEIQNSQAIGGGCIIGWLPVVPEDAEEEGKLGYTTLKLLSDIQQHSKTGYNHTSCYNQVTCWLFPVVLILSVDYEEQCMMSLIHGHNGKCPCPICLVLLEELHDISKMHPICTVEEAQCALHIYRYSCSEGEEVLKALRLWPVE
ncbi:hypothetical protein BKA83DRAFT_4125058, partial [Pisolithus microcarpus]